MYILHLSDLHFGITNYATGWYTQLADDLRGLNCSPIDALILSGDIANKSTPEEYAFAEQFLNKLCDGFSIKRDNIIIVPGNHDLNWDLSEDAYTPIRRKSYQGSLDNSRIIDKGEFIEVVQDEDQYRKRFSHFSKFYENVKGEPYPLREDQQSIVYLLKNHKILFLGLNSAWNLDHHYKKRSSINPNAISNALDKIGKNQEYRDWVKIAVWHHPLHSNSEDRITDHGFMGRLAKAGFCLALHGHIHKAETSLYRYGHSVAGRKIEVISAGTFGASTKELVQAYPWQYQLLELKDNGLKVRTRKREEENGPWMPDARWMIDEEQSLAYYEISLPVNP